MATALLNVLLAHSAYSAPISPHNTTGFVKNVSDDCNDLRSCRTMWGIIYSCLLTIFACIWTVVHPDLPRRGGVSPEAILAFACHQSLLSWRISKKCKVVEGWTSTHSYFVVMDGFFDSSKGRAVDLNDLQKYPGIIEKMENGRKDAITKKEILDRSKGDGFCKFLIVLQLLWFITQYVGRWASHLHRSQLETMTLAYAALNVFVYALWWHKPVNIQFPIHVTQESVPPTSETNVGQPTPKTETDADPMSLVQVSKPEFMELLFIFAATGTIFGGIHCLGWSFPFPTRREMILWRVSAISITVAPIFLFLFVWFANHVNEQIGSGIVAFTPFVYAAARVILVVLTFSSLRSPPPDLYQTPSWSSFLPHFG
ncbi:uncharacterized protein EI90DRAFT_3067108 [Cantharellus anzutake]|uniref:uncharacterized protein n=1 Tax=Cantharellus anzutake TaxID=1750568 RepID=UPI0019057929|nr:uncharacterized protein EI90DRAFT_3067108 [Cantharellus anzutake]KAF8327817.1 hypothetical protein EI90DRAFT_3067108 [Cantharellus anzutake]